MDDRELLALEAATIFEVTDSGRILQRRSPDRPTPPRLWLAGCASGNVLRLRHDVGEETARLLERFASDETALSDADHPPAHLEDYLQLLAAEGPIEQSNTGLIWTFPDNFDYDHAASLVCSESRESDILLARLREQGMPGELVALGFVDVSEFWEPWCVALHEDTIASIAFTVGLSTASAEVGVATVPSFRGRGFAAAATAGWASLPSLSGRTLFYATDQENLSSQRVTQRLGLRFIGPTFTIT